MKGNKMKKRLTLLLLSFAVFALMLALSSCGVLLKKAGLYEGYEYHVDNEHEITITGYKGESPKLEIPSWIDGYKVVGISFDVNDESLQKIESIRIPKTIVSMNSDTFIACTNLKEITVAIDNPEYKFYHGALYTKDEKTLICYPQARENAEVEIPKRVTGVASRAFVNARYLKSLTFLGVEEIGELAFVGCSALETVSLGPRIKSVDDRAFENCASLKSVDFPDSVKRLGATLFEGCSSLTSISVGAGVEYVGTNAFGNIDALTNLTEYEGAYYLGNKTNLYDIFLRVKEKDKTEYVIHPDVNVIYNGAFKECAKLEKIELPNSVYCIGAEAFYNCKNLKEIVIPEELSVIDEYTFLGCSSIADIFIPSKVSEIGKCAFAICSSLKNVTLSNRTASIGNMAFAKCEALEAIELPNTLKKIGGGAFSECPLIESVSIPSSVEFIGETAFRDCKMLTSVTFADSSNWTVENKAVDAATLSAAESAAALLKSLEKPMIKLLPEASEEAE
ncbi:MAG: hypothetical protein E7673_07410 [Ruminococcaceae bacterium]|nr:hypothetical protein [Oscillospiraceae bacterium]